MIAILTGAIRTGKTSALARVFATDGKGVLQPVINGQRHVADLRSGDTRCLEVTRETPEAEHVYVGRFAFDARAFAWSAARVHNALRTASAAEWVIIDEVGPLELAGHGLEPVVHEAVQHGRQGGQVLLVVRDGLVEAVCRAFSIPAPDVVQLGGALPDGRVIPLG